MAVRRSNAVRRSGPVNLVAARYVAVMSPAVAARKAEERHCGHAGGAEYQAEDIEIHLILDVARVASPTQSRGKLSPQIGVQQGATTRTAFTPAYTFQVPACNQILIFAPLSALSCFSCWQRPACPAAVAAADQAPQWSPR